MVLTLEQFSENFGVHPVPSLLHALLDFQSTTAGWYSDSFELAYIPKDGLKTYFGANEEVLAQFIEFGHDGNYSTYALWLYRVMPLDQAPIVYFNSEAAGDTVVADNITELLTLLAWDEELTSGVYADTSEDSIHTQRNAAFRVWMNERYHLQVALNPNEVIQKAQKKHPNLGEWIRKKRKQYGLIP